MAVAGDRLLDRLRSLRLVAGGNSRETGDRVQPHSAKTFHPNRARHRRVDCIWLLHGEELGMRETPAAPTSEQLAEREGARYELLDPSVLQDPYPLYRQMRDEAPVYRDRRFMGWILTRYDDVLAVLRDPRVSSQRPLATEPVGRSLASIATEVREIRQFQGRWMMHLDPPEHTRLRTLVSKAFTATRVEALRETVQALTDELLRPAREAGPIDLVQDLARPLPAPE